MISISHITSKEAELADALAGDAEVTPLMVNHDPVCYLIRPDYHPHLRTIVTFPQLQHLAGAYEAIMLRLSDELNTPPSGWAAAHIEKLWEDMHDGKLFV